MPKGDIRTFNMKRYRWVGWSIDRDRAHEFAKRIKARVRKDTRVVPAIGGDGITKGYDLFREIVPGKTKKR